MLDNIYSSLFPEESELRRLCGELFEKRPDSKDQKHGLPAFAANNKLFDLVVENQMLVVLFERIIHSDRIKPDLHKRYVTRYLSAQLSIRQHIHEFRRVMHKLKQLQIPFIVMKALPHCAPDKNTFHKEVCDLDLLISVPNFQQTATAFRSLGYNRILDHGQRPIDDSTYYEPYYSPKQEEIFFKNPYTVEIHTSFVNTDWFSSGQMNSSNARLLTKELAKKQIRVKFCGIDVWVPQYSRILVSLFIHTAHHHNFQSVVRFYEAASIMRERRSEIDWNYCLRASKQIGATNLLHWYLLYVEWLFPNSVSKQIQTILKQHQKTWSIYEHLLFHFLKYRMFHPRSAPASFWEKKITHAIIERRVFASLRRFFMARIKN